ncbi:hypothetical protein Ssi02_01170 [Sinosporangium siamense]|uniref:Carrier domain-containing protein n=2 Tax=Sinosporangium siamense TaxID=1367973 RepID=A0A919R9I6_9ACTN|nr:hypothetical protein Ssi02_01170 [Sinosporangium siamense]
MFIALRLRGPFSAGVLDEALQEVVARHEVLRTRYAEVDGEPVAVVDAPAGTARRPVLERVDLTHLAPPEREAAASAAAAERVNRPFDLAGEPVLRAALLTLSGDDHVLLLVLHHIAGDGWSLGLLQQELSTLYSAFLAGAESPLPPLAVQYADYAAWLDARGAPPLGVWEQRLSNPPVLELPADRPRPRVKGSAGAVVTRQLPRDLSDGLAKLARRERCTLFMALVAVFNAQLSAYTGQNDICVGSPFASRQRPELEPVIGYFINTMVLRTDTSGDPTFAELLKRVRSVALEAYASEVPFDRLVEALDIKRDLSRTPVFQAELTLRTEDAEISEFGGVPYEPYEAGATQAKFDLALEVKIRAEGLLTHLVYSTDLFEAATVERMSEHFENLVRQVVADPGIRLSALDPRTERERSLLEEWSRATPVPPTASTVHELVEAAAARFPDAPAIVDGDRTLTYSELSRRSGRLARELRALGVGRDDRVAVLVERSPESAVALLGVLKAGGAYVPVDPEQPVDRIAYVLEDSGAAALVADESAPRVAGFCGPVLAVPREAGAEEAPASSAPAVDAGPEDLAYVIYTSGSTGRPKGVAVQHRQILNYLSDVRERFGVGEGERFGLLQSLSFDFGVTVLYLSLMTGGCLHLVPSRVSGLELADYHAQARFDYLKMTPSHLAALTAEVDARRLLPHKTMIFGGEGSSWDWAKELAALGVCEVVNHYGPTETTVGVTTYTVRGDDDVRGPITPIGRPLGHARTYVLDDRLKPVPIGVAGELCIGGDRLAREYLGRPELTAERFVEIDGERVYRTGDLARWSAGGDLVFLGRRDLQVKIRGYRVELGEIDEALRLLPGIAQAVVDARGKPGSLDLVAYLVAEGDRMSVGELRAALAERLPEYMVPTRYVWLPELPLKSHGKVDRAALPEPEAGRPDEGDVEPPSGPVEEIIAAVWADVLDLPVVGALDDFFDLGGHSLLATRVVARLRRELPEDGTPVSVMDLFQHPTVRGLARLAQAGDGGERGLLYRLTRPGPTSLSLVCLPYGGGSAVVYQPLADALPPGVALHAVAVPGHDLGLAEDPRPLAEVAEQCAREILATVEGPLAIYGHCGVGGALAVAVARLLEAEGRELEAVYLGGIFPFARPTKGFLGLWAKVADNDRLRSTRAQLGWLTSLGADLGELSDEQKDFILRNMRHDARQAEEYFTGLLDSRAEPLRAAMVSVVGGEDPTTEYYEERYKEWHFLTGTTALAVIDEAGHYFLKFRAEELAAIVTAVHPALRDETPRDTVRGEGWALEGVSGHQAGPTQAPRERAAPEPTLGRFLTVALGQMVTILGATLTEFAIPIWVYMQTGELAQMALLNVLALMPGVLAAPLVGAIVDRSSRRAVMTAGTAAGLLVQAATAALLWADRLEVWHLYILLTALSVALTFQRVAFTSAIPQLVPKRYLGHANGVAQMTTGVAQFIAPLIAVGLMSVIGLKGILLADIAGYVFALAVLALTVFPATLAHRRRESVGREIAAGFKLSIGQRHFRSMVGFFAVLALLMSPIFLLYSPLVLSFATITEMGYVALCGGLGAAFGGLVMTLWGGPRERRMTGMLLLTLVIAGSCALVGMRQDLVTICIGAFGVSAGLALVNGVYATIIQMKVPQRFHGRVFALNQMVAWSTIPLGVGLVAPFGERVLEPMMAPGGALADTVGAVVGTGPGRGIALMYIVFGVLIAVLVGLALRNRVLAGFDATVPDATPDDLLGIRARKDKSAPQHEAQHNHTSAHEGRA